MYIYTYIHIYTRVYTCPFLNCLSVENRLANPLSDTAKQEPRHDWQILAMYSMCQHQTTGVQLLDSACPNQ